MCLKEREVVLHLLVECAFTKNIWDRGKIDLSIAFVWEGSTMLDYCDWWNIQNTTYPNKVLFENKSPYVQAVVYRALGGVGSHTEIQKLKVNRSLKEIPKDSLIKGWFDGASLSNGGNNGDGGVLWLNEHSTINWTFNCGSGTNTRAKLLGVWETLTLSSRYNNFSEIQNRHKLAKQQRKL